jgi:CIC family chloride channel protein
MEKDQMTRSNSLGPLRLSLLSVLVGIVVGVGAVVFRGLIALFHNLLFLGKLSTVYDANTHTPASPWGPLVILVPVLGALGVAWLVKNFAPEAKGHGVPEVMDAIYYDRGIIRPVVAFVKSVASALSIGSGGAIGREGPIIQIGSSFGSTVGQALKMPVWQRVTLIAAGAAGGIAATFNTPIGGVLFAVEIMLQEVSVRTLVPVAISAATATYVGRIFFGPHPAFVIPAFERPYFHVTNPLVLVSYVGLGVLTGLVSALYIKSIYTFEDFFDGRVKASYYVRHMAGMLAVGITMYVMMITFGNYYIQGVGYATVQDVLSGANLGLLLLLLLFALKLLAVSLTLGSGASGGVFSPGLFMGATLGGAYGIVLEQLFPSLSVSPPAFAVAGMAGLIGGSTGAAMAAIVMIFEMTLDYNVIVPMTITVALSYGVRKVLSRESIYTLKLVRRGHYMPEALQSNFQHLKRAREVMDTQVVTVPASSTIDEFSQVVSERPAAPYYVVEDHNAVLGFVGKDAVLAARERSGKAITMGEIANREYATLPEDATLLDVLARLRSKQFSVFLVTNNGTGPVSADQIKGMITNQQIADAMSQAVEPFLD